MASILLVIVAFGFAPSFYVPSVTNPPKVFGSEGYPAYLIIHGVVLTLWYLTFFVQTVLVATRRVKLHRTLGLAGVGIAAVLVPLSLFVVARSVGRSNLEALPVIGDFGILIFFAILVTLGTRMRRQPEYHKRLMLIASVSIAAPAIARWPGARAALPISVIVPQLIFFAALIAYDLRTRRRVHPATGWGLVGYLVTFGICVPLALSDLGQSLVRSLK